MTLETIASTAEADASKVASVLVRTGILSKLKTGIVSAVTSVPSLLMSAGSLLTGSSLLIKGTMVAAIMFIPVGAYMKGRSDGHTVCVSNAAKAHAKNVKAYAKLKKNTAKMGKSHVDTSLSKWVQ